MTRLLTVTDLALRLEGGSGRELLNGLTLHVDAGEIVGLVGESGSGKSLTARAVLGLLPERSAVTGTVLLGDTDMATADAATARTRRRNDVSMVFQDPRSGVNPVRRIGDFMTESLRLCHGWDASRAKRRALELLDAVRLPHPDRHYAQYPHELSGGMLQRVMIAAALSTEPRLLLCDEPTTALDVTTQAEIIRVLLEQKEQRGMGMLFITHDLNLAAAICDRVYVMQQGSVVESGPADEVFRAPRADYTRRLLAATPTLEPRTSDVPTPDAPGTETPILSVSDLRKTYRTPFGSSTAVDGVSFTVRRGEAFGIVGESGSGKSTIARMLVGLERADSGSIVHTDLAVAAGRRGRAARLARARARQIVFQDPYLSLDPRRPVGRAVEDVMELHYPGRPGNVARVRGLLARVGLGEQQAQSVPRRLSGGQRQRAAIARALAVDPDLLVLDEATSALDVSVQAQVLELLAEIRAERGLALVFVSHDLAVVQGLCERTLVLQRGSVVEQGATRELLARPTSAYTRLLVDSVPHAGWDLAALAAERTATLGRDADEELTPHRP